MIKVRSVRKAGYTYGAKSVSAAEAYYQGRKSPAQGKPVDSEDAAKQFARAIPNATNNWARAWAPYRRVLTRLKLPPRGPKGSLQNAMRI